MLLVYLFHGGLRRLCSSGQHNILETTLKLVIDFEFNVFLKHNLYFSMFYVILVSNFV